MPSSFLGLYNAVYDYAPQSDQELELQEGDLLYVLEKSAEDDWWKAKKKSDTPDGDEPTGLVPKTYIEEARPIAKYRAVYDYTPKSDEETALIEDSIVEVFDLSDLDWALICSGGDYGFAPANYIEKIEVFGVDTVAPASNKECQTQDEPVAPVVELPRSPSTPAAPSALESHAGSSAQPRSPASDHVSSSNAHRATPHSSAPSSPALIRPSANGQHRRRDPAPERKSRPISTAVSHYTDSDESDGPGIPLRRPGEPRVGSKDIRSSSPPIPPGFQTYAVQEVDSKKKRAATLGLGSTRIILVPDKSTRPKEEWAVENLKGYNNEGKHVFLELDKPSRSLDLHAGSTDTAESIIAALGEIRGAWKAGGLDVLFKPPSSSKTLFGTVLYDFPAQGDDEVSVVVDDEVIILDDSNDEWWLVRRQVNGLEGVVPSSYVEKGRHNASRVGIKESPARPKERPSVMSVQKAGPGNDVSPSGVPKRMSSLPTSVRKPAPAKSSMPQLSRSRYRNESPLKEILLTAVTTEPDSAQVRTWTDRSGTFKVEAQFLGCREGKIHLHKLNGVKIAVPVSKMSLKDLEYVERRTGLSLDEDKPLSAIKDQRQKSPQIGIVVDKIPSATASPRFQPRSPKKSGYDWFEFFLSCGVEMDDCQRYALNFERDNMEEELLKDITTETMRTLGLKEGDILRVKNKVDDHYGRKVSATNSDSTGGIFANSDGVLKNNTHNRSRPTPPIHTSSVVSPDAFSQKDNAPEANYPATAKALISRSPENGKTGFDDDAWTPKPAKEQSVQQTSPPVTSSSDVPQLQPAMTGALQDLSTLSLSTPPLQPTTSSFTQSTKFDPVPAPPSSLPNLTSTAGAFTLSSQPGSNQLGFADLTVPYSGTGSQVRPPRPRPTPPTNEYPGPGIAQQHIHHVQNNAAEIPGAYASQFASNLSGSFSTPNTSPSIHSQQPQMQFGSVPGLVSGYSSVPAPSLRNPGLQGPNTQFPSLTGSSAYGPPSGILSQNTALGTLGGMQQLSSIQPASSGSSTFGINTVLPPPLVPQATGAMEHGQVLPLKPQATGPAPNVRFGVPSARKLTPQPTGRADVNKATPDNPFGF